MITILLLLLLLFLFLTLTATHPNVMTEVINLADGPYTYCITSFLLSLLLLRSR